MARNNSITMLFTKASSECAFAPDDARIRMVSKTMAKRMPNSNPSQAVQFPPPGAGFALGFHQDGSHIPYVLIRFGYNFSSDRSILEPESQFGGGRRPVASGEAPSLISGGSGHCAARRVA